MILVSRGFLEIRMGNGNIWLLPELNLRKSGQEKIEIEIEIENETEVDNSSGFILSVPRIGGNGLVT